MNISVIKQIAFYFVFSSRRQHLVEQDNFCFRRSGQAFVTHGNKILFTKSDSVLLAQSKYKFIITGDPEIWTEFSQVIER